MLTSILAALAAIGPLLLAALEGVNEYAKRRRATREALADHSSAELRAGYERVRTLQQAAAPVRSERPDAPL